MGTGGTKIFQTPYGKPLILILIGILFIGAAVAATSLTIPATTISQITAVGYVSHSASSCSGFTTLTSGSSTILVTGDYDVCADYSCPTGCTISSWTITWSS